jgi:CDP-diacylglycerol--glycerol-3-phosphate 3-phosphatidyltransferase
MNLPNKITTARMIAVPFFLAAMTLKFPFHYLTAFIIFFLASVTDCLDGLIARKKNMVTDFGKFLDPLVDKMLTTAAFLGILSIGEAHYKGILWVVFIILFREFAVTGIRLAAASKSGKIIAAEILGKIKTAFQMISIAFILITQWLAEDFGIYVGVLERVGTYMLWISAVLTLISGIKYIIENADYLKNNKI